MYAEDITKQDVIMWAESIIDGFHNEYLNRPANEEAKIAEAIMKVHKERR